MLIGLALRGAPRGWRVAELLRVDLCGPLAGLPVIPGESLTGEILPSLC